MTETHNLQHQLKISLKILVTTVSWGIPLSVKKLHRRNDVQGLQCNVGTAEVCGIHADKRAVQRDQCAIWHVHKWHASNQILANRFIERHLHISRSTGEKAEEFPGHSLNSKVATRMHAHNTTPSTHCSRNVEEMTQRHTTGESQAAKPKYVWIDLTLEYKIIQHHSLSKMMQNVDHFVEPGDLSWERCTRNCGVWHHWSQEILQSLWQGGIHGIPKSLVELFVKNLVTIGQSKDSTIFDVIRASFWHVFTCFDSLIVVISLCLTESFLNKQQKDTSQHSPAAVSLLRWAMTSRMSKSKSTEALARILENWHELAGTSRENTGKCWNIMKPQQVPLQKQVKSKPTVNALPLFRTVSTCLNSLLWVGTQCFYPGTS